MSWGDEPFDGFDAVNALSCLPGLAVAHTAPPAPRLADRILDGLTDDGGLDGDLVQWINAHPVQVREMVEAQIESRESVISDAVDSVLSAAVADVRVAVQMEVATLIGQ